MVFQSETEAVLILSRRQTQKRGNDAFRSLEPHITAEPGAVTRLLLSMPLQA